ncbi:hypothetical protein MPTK1_6g07940 [Marchantia polymorpha subsp. ruderalis]|uniref:NADP-dependent oxidoreductase domain-containing protein n=2 Tax=Marchantia polymorpha TaxID=3197 RepID=A0AAF6BPP9_MARPO|nr:hypothetical protein MARPO_0053s0107 [Marchantia polymorpha]BBN13983.1 hypothetical protein Mp_6g07940 [Marchantia polymorpha subsp. ruderalis]PTQ38187.1 hypothetical protein MARPO_0053s0107 [Marchantia polymorpha]PTQ38188.1 hypothetical protein MARPO_0053s0107 [Marchantia polymorpha]BBN13984.1 hypothetical protein Mp_6g07940 [Marchantia polymorpha subsp. ruderalis]|eukprot:PTQ38185.1 hypothetical protein MARPO_0053s0107 [Marchantia polymorpha]
MATLKIVPTGLNVGTFNSELLRPQLPRRTATGGQRSRVNIRAVSAPVQQALEYRKLGDSDLLVSEITLGTMTWGNQNSESEAHEQLSYAWDQGVNILDAAEVYPIPMSGDTQGRTEQYIGNWLKTMPRDKVIVATKVAGYSERYQYLREGGGVTRVNKKNIKEAVEGSLKRLGTDHIDLLQIHWPDRYVPLFGEYMYNTEKWRPSVPFQEQLEAMQEVIQEGKVRYIGVSNETSFGVMEFLHAAKTCNLPKIVSIQNNYSLLVRCHYEVDLVEVCSPQNGNVGLLAYSPLSGGTLSGKYVSDQITEGTKTWRLNMFPGYMARYRKSLAKAAVEAYLQVANRHNMSLVQLALAFGRDRPFMTSNILGATSMEQLKENISAYQVPRPLAREIEEDIEAVFKKYRDPTI